MAGIYIHIPFCQKKCNYCDFYSIVPQNHREDFIKILVSEIESRQHFLTNDSVDTIYFGGGTPSILKRKEVGLILNTLRNNYNVSNVAEITFEANPENLSREYLKELKQEGVNRLSVGIQSFNDKELAFLKRIHNADKARISVEDAFSIGFENISIDLIYGLPTASYSDWEFNLKEAFKLPIKHLSSYHLSYEEGTLLYKRLKQGRVKAIPENDSLLQFQLLIDYTKDQKFSHYEISNFAKESFYSKHNLSYWQQKKYLGFGPSAHSYDGSKRSWNISNLKLYIDGVLKKDKVFEEELLSINDLANEYLITNLRTKWGVDMQLYKDKFPKENYDYLINQSKPFLEKESLVYERNKLKLTTKGIFVSDLILKELYKI